MSTMTVVGRPTGAATKTLPTLPLKHFSLSLFGKYNGVKVFDNENRVVITDRTRGQSIITMMQRFDSLAVKLSGDTKVLIIVCKNKGTVVLDFEGEDARLPRCESEISGVLYQIQSSFPMPH
ncbi:MAG: hypothetical protein WC449_00740 [Candidatus Paceibacterota bacterium]